jgi:hypothetical protein
MLSRSRGGVIFVAALCTLVNGCVKKYVEIRVHDGGRVGVGAPAGQTFVPVLAPDGSQTMAYFPPNGAPVSVMRQGHEVTAIWQGAQPVDLVNATGTFPPLPVGEAIQARGDTFFAYYGLLPGKVVPASDPKGASVPIALSTPVSNIAEVVEIHEPRRWPTYAFLPAGGLFTVLGAGALTVREDEWKIVGATYLSIGIPLLVVGLVNALQESEAVPIGLSRGP